MRINARLDEEHSRKLAYLQRVTGTGVSVIVKRAIARYYEEITHTSVMPGKLLNQTGFVGCGEASLDLSEKYKQAFGDSLSAKHGHR